MKKIKILLTTTIMFLAFACEKAEINIPTSTTLKIEDYQKIGMLHNDGLDVVLENLNIQEIIKSVRQNHKKGIAKNDYEFIMDALYDSIKNRTEEYLKGKEFIIGDIKVSNFNLPDKDYLKNMFNNINNQNSEVLSEIKKVESSINYFET